MQDVDLSRRWFLRRGKPAGPQPVRPPWAETEHFTDLCTRCGACIAACVDGVLVAGDGGFPEAVFETSECSFCGDCANACPEPIFVSRALDPWQIVAGIGEACLAAGGTYCRSCGDACPETAIGFEVTLGGRAKAQVDGEACSGCGACVSVCPVGAVRVAPAEEGAGHGR